MKPTLRQRLHKKQTKQKKTDVMTQTTLPMILWRCQVTQTHLLLWLAANCKRSLHYTLIRRVEGDICSSVYAVFHRNYDFMCSIQYTHTPVQTSGEFELNKSIADMDYATRLAQKAADWLQACFIIYIFKQWTYLLKM